MHKWTPNELNMRDALHADDGWAELLWTQMEVIKGRRPDGNGCVWVWSICCVPIGIRIKQCTIAHSAEMRFDLILNNVDSFKWAR